MYNNELVINRLEEFIFYKNLSKREFEKMLGFSNGFIGTAKKRGSTIGVDKLIKIKEVYRELSIDWLLFGEGNMIVNQKENENTAKNEVDIYEIVENLTKRMESLEKMIITK